jgi:hypothetical protein
LRRRRDRDKRRRDPTKARHAPPRDLDAPPAMRRPGFLRRRGPAAAPPRDAPAAPGAAPPARFVLHRILGADLEPRHARGQTRANLEFILEHEPPLEGCAKRWVLNRIRDAEEEARLVALLEAHGQAGAVVRLPFDAAAYARTGWSPRVLPAPDFLIGPAVDRLDAAARERLALALARDKILYLMNNNGARNAALDDAFDAPDDAAGGGRGRADWALPWDGNAFLTAGAWAAIRAAVAARPDLRCLAVPMARVPDNARLLAPGFAPDPAEEPQLMLRRDAGLRFDAAFPYGRRPKVELFWRLGLPGPWDAWRDDPWDPPRNPRVPGAAGTAAVATAGWVARLASGREDLERADRASFLDRGAARRAAILATVDRVDAALGPPPDRRGLLCYASAALDALAAGAAPDLAAALGAAAEAALGRGPFSVVDKTTLPPGGNRRDYWHPAPYWHPNRWIPGGLPFVQRDGVRVAGTRLYEPESARYDRSRLQRLFDDTTALALAFAVTGRAELAAHAARNVATWFVDPARAMTPHLRYAQVRRGRNWSQGTGAGIVEFKDLHYFLDAARILESAGALDGATAAGLDAWLGAYRGWLAASRQGRRERAAANNHGTYFDLQTAAIAARLGDRDGLRAILIRAETRLPLQIAPDGTQPRELARRTTAHYCHFNLQGWLALLRLGRRSAILRPVPGAAPWDLLVRALDWTLGQDLARWPLPQIEPFDPARAVALAAHAVELGLRDPAALDAAALAAAPACLDPHDGVPPFWRLTDPRLLAAAPAAAHPGAAAR